MKKYIEIPAEALENIENDKYVLAEGECDTNQVLQLGEEGSRVPTGERGDAP